MKTDLIHTILLFPAFLFAGFLGSEPAVQDDPGSRQPVLEYTTDQSVDVTIYLVSSSDQVPMYYTTRLQSPVCMDNLCNPIDIEIQWDLLGYFRDYVENPNDPVTKFDHQPFTPEDHQKLKSILANTESLLQDYRMEDLVDTSVQIYSEELDATTGATNKTFENDIVSGAIYTCYTLWTFVNGNLRGQLLEHTMSLMNDDLLLAMIRTGKKDYLEYIFRLDSSGFSPKVNEAIGALIWQDDPLISVKAIQAVNEDYWHSDTVQHRLESLFLQKGNAVQNALIQHFVDFEPTPKTLSVFIDLLPELREPQRLEVYKIIRSNKDQMNLELKENLRHTFQSPGYTLTAKEYELLNELERP